jgi:hypothetical protein
MQTTGQMTGNKKRDGFYVYGATLMVVGALVALAALNFKVDLLFYLGVVIAVIGCGLRIQSLFMNRKVKN